MPLKLVRLELARTPAFPDGDSNHGYEIRMPLSRDGRIDAKAFKKAATLCTVRHFRPGQDDDRGQLVRTEGGGWAISYVPGEDDDERMIRLDTHVFRIGEYVSISEHGVGVQAFRVASINDVALSH